MVKRVALLALLLLIPVLPALAADQWVQVRSDHFTVLTDAGEKQGRHVVDQFERMRWMFQVLFPKVNVDPALPIIVLAVRNGKSFQALEPAAYLAKGQLNLGGLFLRSQDKYYVLLRLDLEQEHPFASIYHEYTHLQFSGAGEWMPLWLNEGLAEFIQNTDIHDKDVQLGQASVNDILFLRQNRLIPLATLFKVDSNSPYYHEEQKGSIFYAESWALTHFLEVTDRQKNVHRMDTYLSLVSHHEDPVAAGEKAFGDLKQLQGELESYIRESRYMQFTVSSAAARLDEASYKVGTLTQSQSDAARANFLAYVGRKVDAQALVDSVLKTDPNNALAYETMGYLSFRDGDPERARKSYEQAVKLDSQSYLAHYYFATMSMRAGTEGQDAQIESSLRAAIKLNPRFAAAYDQLAAFYGRRHEKLDEAHRLNLFAVQLEPDNINYRMNAANVLMASDRSGDATIALRVALKIAKTPAETAMVQSRLTEIELMGSSRRFASAVTASNATIEIQLDGSEKVVAKAEEAEPGLKHPTESSDGFKRTAEGVIRSVQCSYPSTMEFKVESAKKTFSFYNNSYSKIDFSALGFTPKENLNPCRDIEGMKSKVEYVESSDKTVDGQAVSIELKK